MVPTVDSFVRQLAADRSDSLELGPYASSGAADTVEVPVRNTVLLPEKYVPVLLEVLRKCTARHMCYLLLPRLQTERDAAVCDSHSSQGSELL